MASKSRWIGFGIVLATLLWASAVSGNVGAFIDPSLLILVLGLVAGGLWAAFGPGMVVEAFGACLRGRGSDDRQRHARLVAVMTRARQLAWGSGVVCTMFGLIAVLISIGNPGSIGPALAVGLIGGLYSAVLAVLVFGPLEQVLMDLSPTAPEGAAVG